MIITPRLPMLAPNRASPQAKGLEIWYPMLGSRGEKLMRDYSGKGLHGTQIGDPPWVLDPIRGWCINNDRATDYVEIQTEKGISFTAGDDFTFSIWLKSSWTDARMAIVGDYGTYPATNIELNKWAAGNVRGYIADSANEHLDKRGAGFNFLDGEWHLCTMVYIGLGQVLRLFGDGAELSITNYYDTEMSGTLDNPVNKMRIGRDGRTTDGYNGLWDDFRIYSRALTPAEVWQLWAPETRYELYYRCVFPVAVTAEEPLAPWMHRRRIAQKDFPFHQYGI